MKSLFPLFCFFLFLACVLCSMPVQAFSTSSYPDLVVTSVEVLTPVVPGGQVSVRATCQNIGQGPSSSFYVEGWIFPQSDYQKSVNLGKIASSGLASGESRSYTFSSTVPAGVPAGKYDIKVAADNSNYTDPGDVAESNENNNEKWLRGVSGTAVSSTPVPVVTQTPGRQVPCERREFSTGNIYAVMNNPTRDLVIVIDESVRVISISDYHWNDGKGKSPGTIALQDSGGRIYGPWQATGSPGQGGVPDANWIVSPQVVIPAGTYTLLDSDPSSWSHNSESKNRGMTTIVYEPAACTASTPVPTPIPTPLVTPTIFTPPSGTAADLWVEGVQGPMTAVAGSTITVTASIGNSGDVDTPQAEVLFALVLSTNTEKAYVIGTTLTKTGLLAHARGTLSRDVTIPETVPSGNYYLGVWIDPDSKIPDTNPDNNLGTNKPNYIMVRPAGTRATPTPTTVPVRTSVPTVTVLPPPATQTATPTQVVTVTRTTLPVVTVVPTPLVTQVPILTPTPTLTVDPATGCYPLNEPMTITKSGTYCVGRDFSGVVKVKASDVTIRGNGHTIGKSGESGGIEVATDYDDSKKTYPTLSGFALEDIRVYALYCRYVEGVSLHGVRVSGTNAYAGATFVSCRDVTITGCRMENGATPTGRTYGIEMRDVEDVTLTGNEFVSNTGDGVMIQGVFGLQCSDNLFDGNQIGLSVDDSPFPYSGQPVYNEKNRDIHIYNNVFRRNTITSVGLIHSPGVVLEGNLIEENGGGITTYEDTTINLVIRENTIRKNKGHGIFVFSGPSAIEDNLIVDNHSEKPTDTGWGVQNADGITLGGNGHRVTGNVVTGNDVGVRLYWDAERSTISNNRFSNRINFFAQGGVGPGGEKIAENTWNVKKTSAKNIMGGPFTGGNFWGQPDGKGFSEVTPDLDRDGFCDLPYTLNEKNIDALPLVDFANPPKITTGSIAVSSTPAGAGVSLDGVPKGAAPVTVSGLSPGTHSITLKIPGYQDFTGTVEVKAGQTVQVKPILTPLPTATVRSPDTPTPGPTPVKTASPVATPTKKPTVTSNPTKVATPTRVVVATKTVGPVVTVTTKRPVVTTPTPVPVDPCSAPGGSTFEEKMAAAVFTETNRARTQAGLPALCWDPKIATVSQGFASSMAAAGKMPSDHNLPGNLVNDRLDTVLGFGYTRGAGENIATGTSGNVREGCTQILHEVPNTPEGIAAFVVDMWMNHDSCSKDLHKVNILGQKRPFTHIGVGVVKGSDGTYYIAQDFGAK